MKKLFLFIALFTLVGISNAQEKSTPKKATVKVEKKHNLDELSQDLNLTETQKAQIEKINADYKTKKQALRATGTADDFHKLNEKKKAEIDAVLTPEQKTKKAQIRDQKIAEKQRKADMKAKK